MKVCLTLSILGSPAVLQALLDDMRRRRPRGWRQTAVASPEISVWARSAEPKTGDPILVFGFDDPLELSVVNVIASQCAPTDLTLAAYNEAVQHFADSIRPLAHQRGLDLRLGDKDEDFSAIISESALESLHDFTSGVGTRDPLADISWARFVSLIFIQATRVRPPELTAWFQHQGWVESEAKRWTGEYVRGYTILEQALEYQSRLRAIRKEFMSDPATVVIQ